MQTNSTRIKLTSLLLVLLSTISCSSQSQNNAPGQDPTVAIGAVLDELHAQAAAANFDDYFALYTDSAVFLGTDRDEYWPIEDFKTYAQPHFSAGTGWTYQPLNRSVHIYENTAWFEEELLSAKYGQVRGTGVLVRQSQLNGTVSWKVAQYNLTLPIPNSLFGDIAKEIDAHYNAATK